MVSGWEARLSRDQAISRIRTRMLPESVRQRPGYRVSGLEIRFEAGERDFAMTVQRRLAEAAGEQLRLVEISPSSPTPGYLSLFACT